MILRRSSSRDLVEILLNYVEILLWRSLHQDLDDALHWCLYESSSGVLIGNSCMMILQGPLQGPSLVSFEILFGVLL